MYYVDYQIIPHLKKYFLGDCLNFEEASLSHELLVFRYIERSPRLHRAEKCTCISQEQVLVVYLVELRLSLTEVQAEID